MTDRRDQEEQREQKGKSGTPALEWIASGIGLVLTVGLVGTIGWQAARGSGTQPPAIEVKVERVAASGAGYVVEIVASNISSATAAGVQIEGTLTSGGEDIATSATTIDYVPGRSERRGGLFFDQDPRAHRLEVRALGYEKP